ncbi:MAG: hypothetical protein H6669_06070 [Ardenticatenaceae bacterium]|nr:hypothetical protein [Ardenticatenaceae bacterium]
MLSFIPSVLSRRADLAAGSKLVIPIAAHKRWLHFPILIYWLMVWLFGELATVNEINRQGVIGSGNCFLTWSVLWTAGGFAAVLDLLWQFGVRQIVSVNSTHLIYRRSLFGLGYRQRYNLSRIHHVRVTPQRNGRAISFDYDDKTIRLATAVDEPDAQQIVTMIRKYITN